ncbi:MAG: hypothetical protein JSR33_04500 [Proteobacteria bacterium]|nr:hypothetical protein [Pseudomonadota bacterium]
MFKTAVDVFSDGYTVASLAEENLRDNKDFEKIKGKNSGLVRRLIYFILAPDQPADSPLLTETSSTIAVAKKNVRRLQALKINHDQEIWLNDLLKLYEQAIEDNAEAFTELKRICQELTSYQTINDSSNISELVGIIGNQLQEIGAKVLMEFSTQIASHTVALVATHGVSGIAVAVKFGFKVGLFVKKRNLKKAIKQQEEKNKDLLEQTRFSFNNADAWLLDYLINSLDSSDRISCELSNYLQAVSRLIKDTILHLNRSGFDFSRFEKNAGFILNELKDTSSLLDSARILVSSLVLSEKPLLKVRKTNISKEYKKLAAEKTNLAKFLDSFDSKLVPPSDLREQAKKQLEQLRKGKVAELVPPKQPIKVTKKNQEAIDQEMIKEIVKLIEAKQQILTLEEQLIEHRLVLMPEFPTSSGQSPQIIAQAQQQHSYSRGLKSSNLNTKPENIFDLKSKANSPNFVKKRNQRRLNHSLQHAQERIEKINSLMHTGNELQKRIDLALELFGTEHGDSENKTEKNIEENFRKLVEAKEKIRRLCHEILKKIKKYKAKIAKAREQGYPEHYPLIEVYGKILRQYRQVIYIVKQAKGTPIITTKRSYTEENKSNVNLVKKLIQFRRIITVISSNPDIDQCIRLLEKFQIGCQQYRNGLYMLLASEDKRCCSPYYLVQYQRLLDAAKNIFIQTTSGNTVVRGQARRIAVINQRFNMLPITQTELLSWDTHQRLAGSQASPKDNPARSWDSPIAQPEVHKTDQENIERISSNCHTLMNSRNRPKKSIEVSPEELINITKQLDYSSP